MSAAAIIDLPLSTGDPETDAVLAQLSAAGEPVEADKAPRKRRRVTSGTSRAERARRAADPAAPKPARPARLTSSRRPAIAPRMAGMYAMAGLGVSMVPSGPAVAGPKAGTSSMTQVVGMELVAQSEALGLAWEAAAKDDPRIREALERLLAVSVMGQIVTAHLPIVLAGLVAGGIAPAYLIGHTDPEPEAPAV